MLLCVAIKHIKKENKTKQNWSINLYKSPPNMIEREGQN